MVHHEGLLELDALYLFEWSRRITKYREQPIKMTYPDGALLRRYTPDFALTLVDGTTVLVEVKPMANLQEPDVAHKLNRISHHLDCSQQRFEVITDQVIREQPRLANLKLIYHGVMRFPETVEAQRSALERIRHAFPMSLEDSAMRLIDKRITPYCLLSAGLIHCDLTQPLDQHTTLHLAEDDDYVFLFSQKELGF